MAIQILLSSDVLWFRPPETLTSFHPLVDKNASGEEILSRIVYSVIDQFLVMSNKPAVVFGFSVSVYQLG